MVRLGDVTQKTAKWNPATVPNEYFTYIDLSALDNVSKTITSSVQLLGQDAPSRARQLIRRDDVLLSTVRPNLNAVATVPRNLEGATASTGFAVLRSDSTRLDYRYLFRWVTTPIFVAEMLRRATGANYPAVSESAVRNSLIPLPPLMKQQRIAAILDAADDVRRKRQQMLTLLDELPQILFGKMFLDFVNGKDQFDWPVKLLKDASLINPRDSKLLPTEKVSFVGMAELDAIRARATARETRSYEAVSRGYTQFQNQDILVAKITPCWENGKIGVALLPHQFGAGSTEFHVIRPQNGLELDYLLRYLRQDWVRNAGESQMTGSAGQKRVPTRFLSEMPIPVPPLELQQEFARIVEAIHAQRDIVERALQKDNELFAALQTQLFR